MTEAIHEAIAAKLQQAQSRYTRSRRALVDVLILAGNPMSVEQIVADAVTLPRPSVYRNLVVLQNCGVVR
ncbi:MAG: hypothetical protein ACREP9_06045, partial [Candidatus Dormibacteraceae bacterium]